MATTPIGPYSPGMTTPYRDLADVLATNLKRVRKALGLTQEEWEERTKVPQPTLSTWERGQSLSQLTKIGKAIHDAGGDPLELFRVAPAGLTDEQREVLDLWERCPDEAVKTAVIGLLRAKAAAPRSAYGIE
jgi:transcriptional regulator with XRE-family HTH domain